MKTTLLIACLGVLIGPAFAQKIIEKKLPYKPGQRVNLNFRFADNIQIRYSDSPEVSVRIEVTINSGKLNDALLVTTESTNDEITVATDYDKELMKQGKAEDCPDARRSSWSNSRDGVRYYLCSTINYQVSLPRQAKLQVETISGNIDIQGASEAVAAKSISGFVDVSWPKAKGAKVAMKTVTGEVYTDVPIEFTGKRQKHPIVGYPLEGTVNGGGPEVRLESVSNDIYLRTKN